MAAAEIRANEPMPVKVKPFAHQVEAYNLAGETLGLFGFFGGYKNKANAGAALLMEQGTGKTLTAIALAGRGYFNCKVQRVFIVAPSSVVPVWPMELNKYAGFRVRCLALTGPVAKRKAELKDYTDHDGEIIFAVTNYEGARSMVDEIIKWAPDMIIFDEAHKLKTPGSLQSKAMAKIAKHVPYRLGLTGTPINNTPLDAFGIYRAIDPSIFGTVYYAFRNQYAVMGGYENREVKSYKNMERFTEKLHSIAYRTTKAECLDLPDMVNEYLYCQLEPGAQRIYDQMRKEAVAELESGDKVTAVNVLAKLLRLSQIAGGYLDTQSVSMAKVQLLYDALHEILGDPAKKVVIFYRFTREGGRVKDCVNHFLGPFGYVKIDGSTPMEQRGDLVEQFQTDPDCRVFIGQIQTVGLGITLTAADTAIFYSCDFSYSNLEQAMSRLHRSGQTNKVTNIFLVAENTVDQKILEALETKRDMAKTIIDDWREVLR